MQAAFAPRRIRQQPGRDRPRASIHATDGQAAVGHRACDHGVRAFPEQVAVAASQPTASQLEDCT